MPVWDTARRPAAEQFDYWREVVCRAFVPLTPTPHRPPAVFPGRVESAELATLNRARLGSVPQRVAHGPREVGRSDGAYHFVNLQLAGSCLVRQRGRESLVAPGWFTVVDTTEPYWFDLRDNWRMLSFRLPHEALSGQLPAIGMATGVGVDGRAGQGSVVSALMQALWPARGQLPVPTGAALLTDATDGSPVSDPMLVTSFASAVGAALGAHCPSAPARHRADDSGAHRAAVLRYVRANLGTADLSVASVSRRFGFSPRYLHTLFAEAPRSYAATVRELRLQRCARLLTAADRHASITDIAGRYGFTDPATFSRAFRRRFGVPPRDAAQLNQVAEGS